MPTPLRTQPRKQNASTTPSSQLASTLAPPSREQLLAALWRMTAAERVAAMWRRELTPLQLLRWTSRRPDEVPLLGGEFAWIVMDTPEWAEASNHWACHHPPGRR
jgi:hypothetical protein